MKSNLILLVLLTTQNVFANGPIAEVVKIRGDVTQLAPGNKYARIVNEGDKFIEDTSIVTGAKSFIKIKFIDQSEINLGPESKVVISEMKMDKPGVISLLKGKMRTEVEKSTNASENKFFIKTRTAAMGVRGTEFQTIYNPENKVTSLLTYHGEVAMKKIDDNQYRKLEEGDQTIKVKRNEETNNVEVSKEKTITDQTEELNKLLNTKDTVKVLPGQNSIASNTLTKATLPVKINPVQLNILYNNTDFKTKDEKNVKELSPSKTKDIKLEIKAAEQSAPLEGIDNKKTGEFAPKAGGLVDLNTGLYIAPELNEKLDSNLGVYISDNTGSIDKDTGEYIAPKGLKLDAVKGFVVKGDEGKDPTILAMKDDLKKSLIKDVVKYEEKEEVDTFNINDKFIREELVFSLNPNSVELENSQGAYLTATRNPIDVGFEWKMSSAERYRFLVGGAISNVNFNGTMPSNYTAGSSKLFNFYFGGMYSINKYFDFVSKLGMYQDQYLNQSSTTYNYTVSRVVTTKVSVGVQGEWSNKYFPISSELMFNFNFAKRLNTTKVKDGSGVGFKIGSYFKTTPNQKLWYGLFNEEHKNEVHGEASTNNLKRKKSGILFNYIIQI